MLRLLVLLNDNQSGRDVRDAHRAIGRIDRLSARPAGAKNVNTQILFVDADIDFLRFGKDGDGGGGGMNAAARFRFGYPLYTVHAGFKFQPRENIRAADDRTGLLEAAKPGLGKIEHFESPPPQSGISLVHPKKLGREKRGLLPTGAGANFQDGIALVVGILWKKRQFYLLLEPRQPLAQRAQLLLGQLLQFGIFGRLGDIGDRRGLIPSAPQAVDALDDRVELAVFLRQFRKLGTAETAAGERRTELGVPAYELLQPDFEGGFH